MAEIRRKPFWKLKRWLVLAVLWLALMYPVSFGPAAYAMRLGLLPVDVWAQLYKPIIELPENVRQRLFFDQWLGWWMDAWLPMDGPNAI